MVFRVVVTAVASLLLVLDSASAQTSRAGQGSASDRLKQAIVMAEIRRAPTSTDLDTIVQGTRSGDPQVQQLAVRALGRLETATVVSKIVPLLGASAAAIRAEAANAVAQALQGPGPQEVAAAVGPLRERLRVETDPTVRGVIYEALGRLPYGGPAEVREIENVLVAGTREGSKDPTNAILLGAARGFEAITRLQAKKGPMGPAVVERVRELVRTAKAEETGGAAANATRVRRLSVAALQNANAADVETLRAGLQDPDILVRKQAASFLEGHGRPIYSDELAKTLRPIIPEVLRLKDPSPLVRYEAVQAYARYMADQGCAPLIEATSDPTTVVAQAAVDGLARSCPAGDKDKIVETLRRLADTLLPDAKPSATTHRTEWHRAAHALVSLASVGPDQAKAILPKFVGHPEWGVRMYGARAAAALKDAPTLKTLTGDPDANVSSTAITGLSRTAAHAEDAVYISALDRTNHQLVQAAARALQGSPKGAEAVPALVSSLARLTAEKKDNTRDARVAIIQRLQELGSKDQAANLMPYLKDFDPRVATLAADTLTTWTGVPQEASPVRPPTEAPNLAEVMKLESALARFKMQTGGTFDLRLYPSEAPATVDRFVRLARAGYYNGLTFHRVAPNWVIQGGSPGANEVVGNSPFMVDEVGLRPHMRGTVGISTRGHDTGDAQFAIDLCDNFSLDHSFTVWSEVIEGMDIVDNVLEDDVIERVDIVTPSRRSSAGAER